MAVLLLEPRHESLIDLAQLLRQRGQQVFSINGQDLVNSTQVEDGGGGQAIWQTCQGVIDFSDITAVYCPDLSALDLNCRSFDQADQMFVEQSWYAYLWHRLALHKHCVNPVQHQGLSLSQRQFPYLMQQAITSGFKAPDYYVSSMQQPLIQWQQGRSVISVQCLQQVWNFIPSTEINHASIAAIACPVGQWVVVHVVGDWVYASQLASHGQWQAVIGLPSAICQACQCLVKRLNYSVAQLLLRCTDDQQYLFYHLTPDVDWQQCAATEAERWMAVCHLLTGQVSPQMERIKPFGLNHLDHCKLSPSNQMPTSSYIGEHLRPKVAGELV